MLLTAFVFLIGSLASGTAYSLAKNQILYSMAIAFGTTFYHLSMRLAVAYIMDARFHNHMDYTKKWFQERAFEPKFYKIIRLKKWKKWLPTFNPKDFLLDRHSVTDMIQATCQAEIIHEVIMILSFVPVIFSVWVGGMKVFIVTSCMSSLLDSVFVILQRYNRPRLMRLIEKNARLSHCRISPY